MVARSISTRMTRRCSSAADVSLMRLLCTTKYLPGKRFLPAKPALLLPRPLLPLPKAQQQRQSRVGHLLANPRFEESTIAFAEKLFLVAEKNDLRSGYRPVRRRFRLCRVEDFEPAAALRWRRVHSHRHGQKAIQGAGPDSAK